MTLHSTAQHSTGGRHAAPAVPTSAVCAVRLFQQAQHIALLQILLLLEAFALCGPAAAAPRVLARAPGGGRRRSGLIPARVKGKAWQGKAGQGKAGQGQGDEGDEGVLIDRLAETRL